MPSNAVHATLWNERMHTLAELIAAPRLSAGLMELLQNARRAGGTLTVPRGTAQSAESLSRSTPTYQLEASSDLTALLERVDQLRQAQTGQKHQTPAAETA